MAVAVIMDVMMMIAAPIVISDNNSSRSYDSPYSSDDWGELANDRKDEDVDLFYKEYDSDVDYYDHDIEDDAEVNRWSDTDSDQYRLINLLENVRKENTQANQMYHDEYPYGHLSNWSEITNVVQGLALGMTSMEERFQNWGRIMILNRVHQPHILKKRIT